MNWKDLVRGVAPALGAALGGPMVGTAVKVLGDKLLGNPDASVDEVERAVLGASPETLVRLREIDREFEKQMAQLGVDVFKLETLDRQNARDRAARMNDWSPMLLGLVIIAFWGTVNWTLLTMTTPPAIDGEIVGRILGMIDAATLAVIYYVYGSSAGSKEKTLQMGGKGR